MRARFINKEQSIMCIQNMVNHMKRNCIWNKYIMPIMCLCRINVLYEDYIYFVERGRMRKSKSFVLKQYENPSEEMMTSKHFFEDNYLRVIANTNLLSEKKSKKIYEQIITYRYSYDLRYQPVYSLKEEYFPKKIIKLDKNEVFIDCGAYNGDTIDKFLKRCNNQFRYIVAFEPDSENQTALLNRIAQYDNSIATKICCINKGVGEKNEKVSFKQNGNVGSKVVNTQIEGDICQVEVVSLDTIPECQNASFIKMDIEGSEYMALRGAEQLIKRNKPKLAVCLYHSDADMIRLIELIHSFVPEYKLYVRQHHYLPLDTVLYAVMGRDMV